MAEPVIRIAEALVTGFPRFAESIRFSGVIAKEQRQYHAVSRSDKETAPTNAFCYQYRETEPYVPKPQDDRTRLGLARVIPQDGRIQLPTDWHWLPQQAEHDWILQSLTKSPQRSNPTQLPANDTERQKYIQKQQQAKISLLKSFFQQDFITFGDFIVCDTDPDSETFVLYDIGRTRAALASVSSVKPCEGKSNPKHAYESASEFLVWLHTQDEFGRAIEPIEGTAPWQRTVICQGLSLASPAAKERHCFPFLTFPAKDDPVRKAADIHLSCEPRGGSESVNPYSSPQTAFHVTFFERLPQTVTSRLYDAMSGRKDLKVGHLYSKSNGNTGSGGGEKSSAFALLRSSFTVLTATGREGNEKKLEKDWYWTILVLSPVGFYSDIEDWRFDNGVGAGIDTGGASWDCAELSCIVSALRKIVDRWRTLVEYIGSLLVEDFTDPTAYSELLFDDASFSKSRLYFWILGCLDEFDTLVEDNIKQWRLYEMARVRPMLDRTTQNKAFDASSRPLFFDKRDMNRLQELTHEANQVVNDLEGIRAQFSAKQKRVIALRDGLFNASALMESRSSTRLGTTVQLLTYVSIFYLPLAFCAALWAIPNISDNSTRTPFIITAVLLGGTTYAIVYKLESLTQLAVRIKSFPQNREPKNSVGKGSEV